MTSIFETLEVLCKLDKNHSDVDFYHILPHLDNCITLVNSNSFNFGSLPKITRDQYKMVYDILIKPDEKIIRKNKENLILRMEDFIKFSYDELNNRWKNMPNGPNLAYVSCINEHKQNYLTRLKQLKAFFIM